MNPGASTPLVTLRRMAQHEAVGIVGPGDICGEGEAWHVVGHHTGGVGTLDLGLLPIRFHHRVDLDLDIRWKAEQPMFVLCACQAPARFVQGAGWPLRRS